VARREQPTERGTDSFNTRSTWHVSDDYAVHRTQRGCRSTRRPTHARNALRIGGKTDQPSGVAALPRCCRLGGRSRLVAMVAAANSPECIIVLGRTRDSDRRVNGDEGHSPLAQVLRTSTSTSHVRSSTETLRTIGRQAGAGEARQGGGR
jgi:hypothetical protein